MNKYTVIVFGGSGFLGSHVVDSLYEDGHRVKVFDIKANPHLCDNRAEMIIGDIMDFDEVVKACKDCDMVYNFAGIADINDAMNRPLDTVRLNVLANVNILEGARLAGAKRFIFASSVYVYSDSGLFYRVSKQASEGFVVAYEEHYGLKFTILRYGSIYGRRADMRNGIYRLLYDAIKDGRISYPGNGNEIRDYIHVQDAAKASVDVLSSEYANQHVILTGNERMRVRDMMLMISEMLKRDIKIEFTNKEDSAHYAITPYSFQPTLGKKLIVNPHIDLGQGIMDCLAELHEKLSKDGCVQEDGIARD